MTRTEGRIAALLLEQLYGWTAIHTRAVGRVGYWGDDGVDFEGE